MQPPLPPPGQRKSTRKQAAAPPTAPVQLRQLAPSPADAAPRKFKSLKQLLSASADFQWDSLEGAHAAVTELMPGPWEDIAVARLGHRALSQQHVEELDGPLVSTVSSAPTPIAEVTTLLRHINVCHSPSIVDVCATGNGVSL